MPLTLSGTTGIAGVDGSASTPAAQGSDTNTGTFYPAADTVAWATGGSERMRVTSAGTVNIVGAGTAGSTQAVSINGSAPAGAMTLDSSGNLLVGTTSASGKIVASNNSNAWGYMNWGNTTEDGVTPWLASWNNAAPASANFGWAWYDSGSTGNLVLYRRQNSTTGNKVIEFNRSSGAVSVVGALSKGSGSFRIDHPLPEKTKTHQLVHSFIEGPQADLIYRGVVELKNGTASINIDKASGMTEGTFVSLCREVQCFTANESDWDAVRGKVNGNILTIESQNNSSAASISWLVIGERQDKHMYETDWTNEDGKVIVEPMKTEAK